MSADHVEAPAATSGDEAQVSLLIYTVTVHTGDVDKAGTNSNISIRFTGEDGQSGPQDLDNDQDNFERNQTDVFTLHLLDLGKINTVAVCSDMSGDRSGWYLDWITIETAGREPVTYVFNDWIEDTAWHKLTRK